MPRHMGSQKKPAPKQPLTHFLCLPIVNAASRPQLETSLERFRAAVTTNAPQGTGSASKDGASDSPSIHPKSIRPVGALHCTLGVMSLSRDQLSEAKALLESLDVSSLLEACFSGSPESKAMPTPITVDLRGLVSMHPPENTSILYAAPADQTDRLYSFCVAVQKHFNEKGFLVPDDRPLKLHATIVNTIYSKDRKKAKPGVTSGNDGRSQGHGSNANASWKFDATAMLETYKDYTWAESVRLNRIAICEMGAKKVTDANGSIISEEYTEVASCALPT